MKKGFYRNNNKIPGSGVITHNNTPAVNSGQILRICVNCGGKFLAVHMRKYQGGGMVCHKCFDDILSKSKAFRLPDEHLEKAKQICGLSKPKANCNKCYGRGYTAVNQSNEVVPCSCVNNDVLMYRWKNYVIAHRELHEHYSWALEDGNHEISKSDEKKDRRKPNSDRRIINMHYSKEGVLLKKEFRTGKDRRMG